MFRSAIGPCRVFHQPVTANRQCWLHCRYLESVRRFNYTTPKSYLELISLYKGLLEKKRAELRANKERLENGVDKISQASAQVRHLWPSQQPGFTMQLLPASFVHPGSPVMLSIECGLKVAVKVGMRNHRNLFKAFAEAD